MATVECGCGYEWDGTIEGAETHDCPADKHMTRCGCDDAYDACEEELQNRAEFSQAIEILMNNEETRTALLEKLMAVLPGNAEIELANLYFTNHEFENDLNNHIWQQVS